MTPTNEEIEALKAKAGPPEGHFGGLGSGDCHILFDTITQLRARAEAAERAYALLHQEIIALAMRKTASDERSIGAHQAANELHERAQELAKMILLAYGENGIWNKRPETTND